MRRPLALGLAPSAALALLASPAVAQVSPAPSSPTSCPAAPCDGPPSGSPTPQATGTPCPDGPSCDLPGGTPPPSSASPGVTPAPSPRPPCPTVTPGPGGPVHPQGCEPSSAPTHVDHAVSCPDTPRTSWSVAPNEPVQIAVTEASDTATVTLTRTSPSPVAVVRSGTGGVVWTVRVPERTTLSLQGECSDGRTRDEGRRVLVIDVEPVLTLSARRAAPRDYSFTGRVTPGRGQTVGLYRVEAQGRQVPTASAVVRPDGTYRIDRRFLGSGRFGFVVRVAGSERHRAGTSPLRPTVVH